MEAIKRSIWVFHLNTGSCNGCDIEILDILTPFHDAERFGVKLVGTPRHADALLLTGPITRQNIDMVIKTIKAAPDPKIVVAIGSCACGGGIWHDSFSVLGGVNELYKLMEEKYGTKPPLTVYVPGCPPRPEAILHAIACIRGLARMKQKRTTYIEPPIEK